jgi:hypothetical protein
VAQLRLADLQKDARKKAEKGQFLANGKVSFEAALQAYREKGFRPVIARNQKDARPLKPAALAYYEERTASVLKSCLGLPVGQIASHLLHPQAMRFGDNPGNVNLPHGQSHHKANLATDQPHGSPHFHAEEVRCCQYLPMGAQELLPGLPFLTVG